MHCIEYPLGEGEVLPFILRYHQPRHTWNSFVRISIARRLKPALQQRALDNMRAGGKNKGLTNLSKADRIDVRQQIAMLAGTGVGNVTKVETILERAHPSIIVALQNALLSIHRAWQWCKLSKMEQKEEFARYEEERTRRKLQRELSVEESKISLDPAQVIKALQLKESQEPGSITIETSPIKRTIIVLGRELLAAMDAQRELDLIG